MVRHPRLLFRRWLGGSDVHLPIELAGIHVDHGQIKPFGDVQRQGGFAAGGGPEQGDHQGRELFKRVRWCSPAWNGR